MVLAATCFELLLGLQPRSKGSSLHICTVLQHLLLAHDREVSGLLLQYHAPFVLLRALDRPGCGELLQSLLGCDAVLPRVVPGLQTRQLLPVHVLHQVRRYLQTFGWPAFVAAVLDQGAKLNASCSSSMRSGLGAESPQRRLSGTPSSPTPHTPGHKASWHGQSPGTPGQGLSTPNFLATPLAGFTPCSTPQRFSAGGGYGGISSAAASPFKSLDAPPPSSPSILGADGDSRDSRQVPPSFLDLPIFPLEHTRHQQRVAQGRSRCSSAEGIADNRATAAVPPVPPVAGFARRRSPSEAEARASRSSSSSSGGGCLAAPAASTTSDASGGAGASAATAQREARTPAAPQRGEEGPRGVDLLLEFLLALLEAVGRIAEACAKARLQQRQDPDTEARVEAQSQLLQELFVDTPLVSHLFKLLRQGAAEFESAALLHALMQHVLHPRRCLAADDLVEPVLARCLANVDCIGQLLVRSSGSPREELRGCGGASGSRRTGGRRAALPVELRLSGNTVQEPLGSLRVVLVQVLAALSDLAPDGFLPLVKPAVWSLLARWFFAHRCNHIFQAACGRLWIAVINHGSPQLQHLVFAKLRLLVGLCETVLAEGACGDRWHESRLVVASAPRPGRCETHIEKNQVMTCKARHPGGLGSIVPVILALAEQDRAAAASAAAPPAAPRKVPPALPAPQRAPLAERSAASPQVAGGAPTAAMLGGTKFSQPAAAAQVPYVAKLLAATSVWPQVLRAVQEPPQGVRRMDTFAPQVLADAS
eukprot:TRINITY_DN29030_c0_g1_i2.p1 TRINITY_DN29030_c0_g1~~TRINITY_DN29030_c0_g1_i2.p1  ORF type:complete len:874 (-),score=144.22 TRINITY_DN29030_c0_g1_i2:37-2328(-)